MFSRYGFNEYNLSSFVTRIYLFIFFLSAKPPIAKRTSNGGVCQTEDCVVAGNFLSVSLFFQNLSPFASCIIYFDEFHHENLIFVILLRTHV